MNTPRQPDPSSKPAPPPTVFNERSPGPTRYRKPRPVGVLPRHAVRTVAFGVISLSIFACGGLCLLAVWDFTDGDVSWRAVASLGIVAAMMGMFAFVNDLFGGVEGAKADDARNEPRPRLAEAG